MNNIMSLKIFLLIIFFLKHLSIQINLILSIVLQMSTAAGLDLVTVRFLKHISIYIYFVFIHN